MIHYKYTLPMIEELKKCLLDNSYFSKKYFDIDSPQVSPYTSNFINMSDEQAKVYMLWHAIFNHDQVQVAITETHVMARDYISDIIRMMDGVEPYMLPNLKKGTSTEIQFENGSRILALSGHNAGKGRTINALHLTYYSDIVRASLLPCVMHGSVVVGVI